MDDGADALVAMKVAALLDGGGDNIYNLVLQEVTGPRRMVMTIGVSEAQAIAVFMEGIAMPRPMTHDLMARIVGCLGGRLSRVIIEGLDQGRFLTQMVFEHEGLPIVMDARTSDAVALAIRCQAPILARESVLELAGAGLPAPTARQPRQKTIADVATQELKQKLDEAVQAEDYETAQRIQEELRRRGEASAPQ